jgi:hypothetical protein
MSRDPDAPDVERPGDEDEPIPIPPDDLPPEPIGEPPDSPHSPDEPNSVPIGDPPSGEPTRLV